MRPIWSGSISFGLVNIPVNLISALTHKKIRFHLLHKKCGTRIEYQKHCPKCNLDLSWQEVSKAYEYQKGKYVPLTESDFKKVDIKLSREIEIQYFISEKDLDPIYYSHPYYLMPAKDAEKAYFLLHEAMLKTEKIALAKLILKDREHVVLIKPKNNLLICEVLHFAEEIVEPKIFKLKKPEIKKKELELARGLIFVLSKKLDFKKFKDEYQEKLMKLIKRKIKGEKIVIEVPIPKPTKIEELMTVLKESMRTLRATK